MKYFQKKLKEELTKITGLRNVVLTSSCRNALYLVLANLNLRSGDEVIIQSFICGSLPLAIEKAGGKVVFAEVNEETFNLDVHDIEQKITPQTKAVIFVHTYGNPTGIAEIQRFCQQKKIILIEDIAHAFGARYNHQLAGTFGDYAVYSFTKQMINIGGGAVLTNHSVEKIVQLKNTFQKSPPLIDYGKRLISSLYETRAFFLSKVIIDIVRRRKNLQLTNSLSPHFNCSELEALLAWRQIFSLPRLIQKRKNNHLFLARSGAQMQKISPLAKASYNYLSFVFSTLQARNKGLNKHFLFLPPWNGSMLSHQLIFVPNNPFFSKRRLQKMSQATTIFINEKNRSQRIVNKS